MKKEEATQKTTSALLNIARAHFTQYGYHDVSLEHIAAAGQVTRGAVYHHYKNKKGLFLAVLDQVQKDVAAQIEREAEQSDDLWEQLILGCLGFVKGANQKECRRILLVDAPAVVGWEEWRKVDLENSQNVLQKHIEELSQQGYLAIDVAPVWMTTAISGALNELALNYPGAEEPDPTEIDAVIRGAISRLVEGFRHQEPTSGSGGST